VPNTTTPNYEALRRALSALRAERNYTYERLAELSGLSRTAVINLEVGNRFGTLASWFALTHAFDVPFGDFMRHLDEPKDGAEPV
jgi:putative transcriptional regulator